MLMLLYPPLRPVTMSQSVDEKLGGSRRRRVLGKLTWVSLEELAVVGLVRRQAAIDFLRQHIPIRGGPQLRET